MRIDEFLLARIAEDEAVARGVQDDDERPWEAWRAMDEAGYYAVAMTKARVLAECAAKRAIVDQFTAAMQWADDPGCINPPAYRAMAGGVLGSLSALAAVYADHPDYRDEWRA